MRRTSRTLSALTAVLVLVASACGGDDSDADDESTTTPTESSESSAPSTGDSTAPTTGEAAGELGAGEGSVNLIVWAGYAEDGSTDPAVDWVTPFEEETGCAVNTKLGNSSDEMVQLMQTGEYDAVSASGDATERLIAGGEVVPVNTDLIPNYADVFDDLKLKQWNSVDGVPYGVPHGRGANLLVWNTEAVTTAPTSWDVMFEGGTPADGSLSVYDSPIYIADAALYLMAHQPDLKITNPYALDQAQFDAAIDLLETQQGLGVQYWATYTDQQAALEGGTALAGTTWQVIVNLASANGATIEAAKPSEGATGWSDTWMISSKAKHPNCAYMWLDWIISPEANAQVAEWFGEAPSNAKSCTLTADPEHCTTFHAEDAAYWEDVWYWTTPTKECIDGRTDVECKDYTEWVDAWNQLRS